MAESIVVQVEPSSVEITPGGRPAALKIRVVNGTSIVDQFTVSLLGGEGWLVAPEAEVRLLPGAETTADLQLSIPADRFVTAGPRALSVRVASASDSRIQQLAPLTVTVGEVMGGLTMRLDPQVVSVARHSQLLVHVQNPGNAPVSLKLSAEESKGLTLFAFQPQELTVPPGYEAAAAIALATRRPFLGTEESRAFTVHAEGPKGSLSASGTLNVRPVISRRLARTAKWALGLLALLVAAGVALALWLGFNIPVPDVTGMTAAEAQQKLEDEGFEVEVSSRADDEVAEGLVIEQSPAGGEKAATGDTVKIAVSLGPELVAVPNVVDLPQEQAMATLASADLRGSPSMEEFSEKPKGTVIDQSPKAGEQAPKNSAVTLTVSKGVEEAAVPDVQGMSEDEARSALEDAGFEVTVSEEPSDDVPAGSVIWQFPAADEKLAKGEKVEIGLSTGPWPFDMPNVVGMTEQLALQTLEDDLGLDVEVRYEPWQPNFAWGVGQVMSQDPSEGIRMRKGDTATIVVVSQ